MSSLIAFLNNDHFIIATDTLVHSKSDAGITFVNFCSKTLYLPQYKCCFAGQGLSEILNQYFIFAQEKVIASDLHSLLAQTKLHFKVNIEEKYDGEKLGTIFLFGLSEISNRLEVHKIAVSRAIPLEIEEVQSRGILHKPEILNIESIINAQEDISIPELLILLMKEQKTQDDEKDASERAVIGGQIQISAMNYNSQTRNLNFNIEMFDSFDDFETLYETMITKSKKASL